MARRARAATRWSRKGLVLAAFLCELCRSGPAKADEPKRAPLRPDYVRAAVEVAGFIGLATVWYFVDDRNVLDWDKPSAASRFTGEAWRFDNNSFPVNSLLHPAAGAGMYALARGNRLGVGPAFAVSAIGSTVWDRFASPLSFGVSLDARFRRSGTSTLESSLSGHRALVGIELVL